MNKIDQQVQRVLGFVKTHGNTSEKLAAEEVESELFSLRAQLEAVQGERDRLREGIRLNVYEYKDGAMVCRHCGAPDICDHSPTCGYIQLRESLTASPDSNVEGGKE